MAIDRKKIALIQVAKQQLGLDDDTYRAILHRLAGVKSSKDLDEAGFKALMIHFEVAGFVSTATKRNFGERRQGMASSSQVAKLRKLWAEFTGGAGTDASLGKWLEGRFKVSSIRFVTSELASKAIAGLINVNERRTMKAAAS
ncbi:MAG: regulatory protein GemA [Rhodospirillaceae bacterium]